MKKDIKDKLNNIESISFVNGILGFPDSMEFVFSPMEEDIDNFNFWAMINIDNNGLNFTVLPIEYAFSKNLISLSDIKDPLMEMGLSEDMATAFIIVKAVYENDILSIYVNLQAPIIIDLANKNGYQVLLDEKYSLSEKVLEMKIAKEKTA